MYKGNVYSKWKHVCDNNEEAIGIYMHVKELINMRDRCINVMFKRGDGNGIIDLLCTKYFSVLFLLFYIFYFYFE